MGDHLAHDDDLSSVPSSTTASLIRSIDGGNRHKQYGATSTSMTPAGSDLDSDTDTDEGEDEVQDGVRRIKAVSRTWTKWGLVVAYMR